MTDWPATARIVVAIALLFATACSSLGSDEPPTEWLEVARARSSSGRLDAVLVEEDSGAAMGIRYKVFVVPHRAFVPRHSMDHVAVFGEIRRSDSALGLNLRWRRGDTLALEYLRASRYDMARPTLVAPLGPAAIVLRPGVVDSTAPAGSMLRNLFGIQSPRYGR